MKCFGKIISLNIQTDAEGSKFDSAAILMYILQ